MERNNDQYIAKQLDYWMLDALSDAVEFYEKGYTCDMVHGKIERAKQTMQIAASLDVIDADAFTNICRTLTGTVMNKWF